MRHSLKCLVAGIICVILSVTGCYKRRAAAAPPPPLPPPPVIIRVDAPVPVYQPVPTSLPDGLPLPWDIEREQADRAFSAGGYDEAISAYESVLLLSPSERGRDEALFRLGLCYTLRNKGESDWYRANAVLKQLVTDYPGSPLKPPAAVILNLRSQANDLAGEIKAREQAMKQLNFELERLKKIDADRVRRR